MIRSVVLVLSLMGMLAKAEGLTNPQGFTFRTHAGKVTGLHFANGLYKSVRLDGHPVLFVVHDSELMDPEHVTAKGIERLAKFFSEKSWNQIQLMTSAELDHKELPFDSAVTVIGFQGDSHRISHRGLLAVFAGGSFTRALCTAVQSYVALSETRSAKIYLPEDAIYENQNGQSGIHRDLLSSLTEKMKDEEFFQFVSNRFVGNGFFCPEHSMVFLANMTRRAHVSIYRKDKLVGTIGEGSFDVQLIFTESGDINLTQ